jgi:hypothetical protein
MNFKWEIGNRTFLTAAAGAGLLAFLAFNNAYPVVSGFWEGVLVKAAGALLGVSVYYLRDAIKRLEDRLGSFETKLEKRQ